MYTKNIDNDYLNFNLDVWCGLKFQEQPLSRRLTVCCLFRDLTFRWDQKPHKSSQKNNVGKFWDLQTCLLYLLYDKKN